MTVVQLARPLVSAWARTFPGQARQVGEARRFTAWALTGCPARDSLLACVAELAANAVEHTDSGDGGVFTVTVGLPRDGAAFVAVTDDGGPGEPSAGVSGEFAEGGRGLAIVAAFSSRWGWRPVARGRLVWAEATWPVAVQGPDSRTRPLELRGVA
jgi:anti-sigma regulatory factor (Ser/Thr protein kinase)